MAHLNHPKEPSAKLLARAASCDVTPRDRPIRLAGYALRQAPVAAILDPIEISAVLLECSGHRCLIVSFDLMMVGSELQDMIHSALGRQGYRPDETMLLASHTHYAPATDQACHPLGVPDMAFVSHVAEAVGDLVRQIHLQQPSEVDLELFQGPLEHSINRRRYWPFPTLGRTYGFRLTSISLAPSPSGPKDERATVVLLRKANDEVLGIIWHYTCHPTAVFPENVISADYPGAVRRLLRERFGQIPCVFAQGFCGNIRPGMAITPKTTGWRERLGKIIRLIASGPTFASPSSEDWVRWSRSLASHVCDIARRNPAGTSSPASLQSGSAAIPLSAFFEGLAPDKVLTTQVVRIGEALEIVAVSAEANVEWERILDDAIPASSGRIRLYAGYLGALFGYLPTATQVPEGGYEVEGFQRLFGLSGRFKSDQIGPAVTGCVKSAFEDLDRAKRPVTELASPAQ